MKSRPSFRIREIVLFVIKNRTIFRKHTALSNDSRQKRFTSFLSRSRAAGHPSDRKWIRAILFCAASAESCSPRMRIGHGEEQSAPRIIFNSDYFSQGFSLAGLTTFFPRSSAKRRPPPKRRASCPKAYGRSARDASSRFIPKSSTGACASAPSAATTSAWARVCVFSPSLIRVPRLRSVRKSVPGIPSDSSTASPIRSAMKPLRRLRAKPTRSS